LLLFRNLTPQHDLRVVHGRNQGAFQYRLIIQLVLDLLLHLLGRQLGMRGRFRIWRHG
jgi:hypothetical protein